MGKTAISKLPTQTTKAKSKDENITRTTEEMVIGLVGAVGAGVSKTALVLKKMLEMDYLYSVKIIKASEIIQKCSTDSDASEGTLEGAKRISSLQKKGTKLREDFGDEYLALKAIELIALERGKDGYTTEGNMPPQAKPLRQVTIIDSLKHQSETMLLRQVYGGVYWQFTVFANETVREDRLKQDGVERNHLAGIFTKDDNDPESADHGQKVSKTAYLSDFFIRNDDPNEDRLKKVIERFLEIMFNSGVHTPTQDEAGMFAAVSAANKSACLSRQVGASIFSRNNELVSIGWNDVPKGRGGLYTFESGSDDHRCYKWGRRFCHNDHKKEDLYKKVFAKLSEKNLLVGEVVLLFRPVSSQIKMDQGFI